MLNIFWINTVNFSKYLHQYCNGLECIPPLLSNRFAWHHVGLLGFCSHSALLSRNAKAILRRVPHHFWSSKCLLIAAKILEMLMTLLLLMAWIGLVENSAYLFHMLIRLFFFFWTIEFKIWISFFFYQSKHS